MSLSRQSHPNSRHLAIQLCVLLGIAAFSLVVGWFDGISGLFEVVRSIHAQQVLVTVTTRWHMSAMLPIVSLVALALMAIAVVQKRLFGIKPMIVLGAVVIGVIITASILCMLFFDGWLEAQGYQRCRSLDLTQGVNRHGVVNVEAYAWTPLGRCE